MKLQRTLACGLLALSLSLPALAMNLNEAMSALGAAKSGGQLGEQPNGYLGVVKRDYSLPYGIGTMPSLFGELDGI